MSISLRCLLLAAAVALCSAVAVVQPTVAGAGVYVVRACGANASGANNAWSYVDSVGGQIVHGNGCDSFSEPYSGLWVYERLGPPDSRNDVSGYWSFTAPNTTRATKLDIVRYLRTYDDPDWRSEIVADGRPVEACSLVSGVECVRGGPSSDALQAAIDAVSIRVGIRCARPDLSGICLHGGTIHSAIAVIYSATVTIDDPKAPVAKALTGSLVGGGWRKGTETVSVTGSDETGIDVSQVVRDGVGVPALTEDRACDFTLAAPCEGPGTDVAKAFSVDTRTWSDGVHQVSARVTDAAGNAAVTAPVSVSVDNTAPAAPLGLVSDTGPGWTSSQSRTLTFSAPPGQASPISEAVVRLCKQDADAQCTSPTTVMANATGTTSVTVVMPGPGSYAARVHLRDAAGNAAAGNVAKTTLLHDPTPPPAPTLGAPQQQGTANDFSIPLTPAFDTSSDPSPLDRSGGEVCRTDGTDCVPLPAQAQVTTLRASVPGPGTWLVRAWVIDRAGNASPAAGREVTYTPAPEPGPTPTPTPVLEPTPQATATPLPTPTATPTPTPAKRTVRITVPTAKLTGNRLTVAARLPASTRGGRVTVRFRATLGARRVVVTKRLRIDRRGRVGARLNVPAATRSGTLTIAYAGNATHRAKTVTKRVRRR